MSRLGVLHPRTGLRRADSRRPGRRLCFAPHGARTGDETAAFCFMPEFGGFEPRHTSSPKDPMHSADFSARMIERPAPVRHRKAAA